jgi:hypothetical protein
MASFLARAMGAKSVAGDSFSDDDGSVFEDAIESLAAVGVTSGCSPGRYCPDVEITRGEMAAFLVRARSLPAVTGTDLFVDDDGSVFESAIESLTAARITSGCSDGRFCPDDVVTRGQMAAFLVRAFDM